MNSSRVESTTHRSTPYTVLWYLVARTRPSGFLRVISVLHSDIVAGWSDDAAQPDE